MSNRDPYSDLSKMPEGDYGRCQRCQKSDREAKRVLISPPKSLFDERPQGRALYIALPNQIAAVVR